MPTSPYCHIGAIVNFLMRIRPSSILDVGLGNGKIGFIARDLLDVMLGERFRREEWQVKIDGIEVFPDYIQEHQRAIYDSIFIGDALQIIDDLGKYDLIVLGDVVEHFEKAAAWEFLDKCANHSTRYMMICIPLGDKWTQPDIYGNEYERHRSFWNRDEFTPFVYEEELFNFENIGPYGAFLVKVEDYMHYRIREKGQTLFMTGREYQAVSYMINAMEGLTVNLSSEFMLIDILLKVEMPEHAIHRLERLQSSFPEDPIVSKYLNKLKDIVKPAPSHQPHELITN
jgi:hypothetical protein